MKKHLLLILSLLVLASACTKKDDTKDDTKPTPSKPSGFVPPTVNYWIVNADSNTASADAGHANILANEFGLSKPFGSSSNYKQLGLTFYSNKVIRDSIPEGSYKTYYIAKSTNTPTNGNDSVMLQVTAVPYYYWGDGGVLYISKKNNKLRFTVDANVNLKGLLYPDTKNYNQTATTRFSWEEL